MKFCCMSCRGPIVSPSALCSFQLTAYSVPDGSWTSPTNFFYCVHISVGLPSPFSFIIRVHFSCFDRPGLSVNMLCFLIWVASILSYLFYSIYRNIVFDFILVESDVLRCGVDDVIRTKTFWL